MHRSLRPIVVLMLFATLTTPLVADAQALATPASPEAQTVPPPSAITAYSIDVTLNTETNQIGGTESIDWRNTTGRAQTALYLRLYPNADYYGEASTAVERMTVDGGSVTPAPGDDPTLMKIPLGKTVAADGSATISLRFTTNVPLGSNGSFGIFQLDPANGVWSLADWYPILAGWEPERKSWYTDAPTSFGDPTFSDVATYAVKLTAPASYAIASTGDVHGPTGSGDAPITRTISTVPVRDFAMTLLPKTESPQGQLVQKERTVSGVDGAKPFTVRVSLLKSEAIPGLEDAILAAATSALPAYAGLLSELPEDDLDITSASLAGANGVSWSGLVWLDLSTIIIDRTLSDQEKIGLTFVVTHEVGHQWIGGLIGNNSNDHGFMTEGLTNALALDVLRETQGGEAAVDYLQAYVAGGYIALLRDGRDVIADAPITDDTNGVLRSLAIYGKAALGFEVIRQDLGDEAFREAMRAYASAFAYGNATPEDLLGEYTSAASPGEDVASLWNVWFERQTTKLADVDPIIAGAGD
ncbi:MAG TPA: M1 family aminopeptidase [Thermomicrobiales bacterium]|nr:M1 family aminopeptidase [Thermomicrobiales bacterium]